MSFMLVLFAFVAGAAAASVGLLVLVVKGVSVLERKARREFESCSQSNTGYLRLLAQGDVSYAESGENHMRAKYERKVQNAELHVLRCASRKEDSKNVVQLQPSTSSPENAQNAECLTEGCSSSGGGRERSNSLYVEDFLPDATYASVPDKKPEGGCEDEDPSGGSDPAEICGDPSTQKPLSVLESDGAKDTVGAPSSPSSCTDDGLDRADEAPASALLEKVKSKDWMGRTKFVFERRVVRFPDELTYNALVQRARRVGDATSYREGLIRFQIGGKRDKGRRYLIWLSPILYWARVTTKDQGKNGKEPQTPAVEVNTQFNAIHLRDCVMKEVVDPRVLKPVEPPPHEAEGRSSLSVTRGLPSVGLQCLEIRHPNRKMVRSADYIYLFFESYPVMLEWKGSLSRVVHYVGKDESEHDPAPTLQEQTTTLEQDISSHMSDSGAYPESGRGSETGRKGVKEKLRGLKSKLELAADEIATPQAFLASWSSVEVVERETNRRPAMTGTVWMQRGEEPITNLRRSKRFAVLIGRALHHYSSEKVFSANRALILIGGTRISVPAWQYVEGKAAKLPVRISSRNSGEHLIPGYSHVYLLCKDEGQRGMWVAALQESSRSPEGRPARKSTGKARSARSVHGLIPIRHSADGVNSGRQQPRIGEEEPAFPDSSRRRWTSVDADGNRKRLQDATVHHSYPQSETDPRRATSSFANERTPRRQGDTPVWLVDFIRLSSGSWPSEGPAFDRGVAGLAPDHSWIRLVSQRFFEHYSRSDSKKAKLVERFTNQMNSKVDEKGIENLLGNVVIDELDMGTIAPEIMTVRNVEQPVLGEVGMLMDMRYAGRGMRMRGSATIYINWPRPRYAAIPISMCVVMRSLRGVMYWHCTPFPDKRFSWAFVQEPDVEFDVDITAGNINKGYTHFDVTRLPKVRQLIVWKLKQMLHEKWVLPNRKYFRIPGTKRESTTQEMLGEAGVRGWLFDEEDDCDGAEVMEAVALAQDTPRHISSVPTDLESLDVEKDQSPIHPTSASVSPREIVTDDYSQFPSSGLESDSLSASSKKKRLKSKLKKWWYDEEES